MAKVDLTKLKFDEEGNMRWFPGNTIVCNLYDNPEVMDAIRRVQSEYRKLPFARKYSLTPEGSIHMTVFELLCHFNRRSEYWSRFLDLDEELEKMDVFFHEKLSSIPFPDGVIQMKAIKIGGTNLLVNPVDEATNKLIRGFRDQLAEVTGVRFPNHDTYQFHISFGYRIHELTEDEQKTVDELNRKLNEEVIAKMGPIPIKKIDYTVFEDMSEFVPYSPSAREELKKRKIHKN